MMIQVNYNPKSHVLVNRPGSPQSLLIWKSGFKGQFNAILEDGEMNSTQLITGDLGQLHGQLQRKTELVSDNFHEFVELMRTV